MNFSTYTIQPEILSALAPKCSTYLEMGVQEGRSLNTVCRANPSMALVTLCDTWGGESGGTSRGSHVHIQELLGSLGFSGRVQYLDGDSKVLIPTLSEQYDLVHVDGGHDYETAASDLKEGWRLCRGYMVVHDISFQEVWKAFYEFTQSNKDIQQLECYFGGYGTAVVMR